MAAPDLSPPPFRSTLSEKDGKTSPIWSRWLQQLWDWLKQLRGLIDTEAERTDDLEERVDVLEGAPPPASPDNKPAMYYQPASQAMPNGVVTIIDFSVADISHANVVTGAGWRFTATESGVYAVSAGASLVFPTPTAGVGVLALNKNGTEWQRLARTQGVISSNCLTGTALIRLAAGEFIDLRMFQNSGVPLTLDGGRHNWVAIHKLLGP